MASDYEKICLDNIRRRGEEFDDIGRLISEQLYSDRTHFILELLQNAEDALERRHRNNPENKLSNTVKFVLFKDRLEFRHFGELFNHHDVKGISDVLKGTKSEDKAQIGTFGIGFKSVYAFTSTPEIHSGDEHFIIERYIRPRLADKIPEMPDGETVFIFPFNHNELTAGQAFSHIENKLKKIGSRILLFLKHISEIEWKIDDQNYGQYLKESKLHGKSARKITVIGQHGNDDEEEEWLVFERILGITNESSERFVEVAFKLKKDEKSKKQKIQKIQSSPLIVYFPTKLETRLGFLVQGPYDTTASRSDIEDNEWNKSLIEKTAILLTEQVLPTLKEMGLLTVSLLEALPIKVDDFPENSVFRTIYTQIRNTLCDQDLLPTANDGYVAGKYAILARGEDLVHLLNPGQLSILLENPQKLEWLTTEISENRKDIYRYLIGWKPSYWETGEEIRRLIFTEIRPEEIIRKLTSEFLQKQSNTWLLELYLFFKNRKALWDKLKYTPIIRLQDGTHVPPFQEDDSPNAFIPPEGDTEFPVVSTELTKDKKALEFLKELGLTEPDTVEEVTRLLPKYAVDSPNISVKEHMHDSVKIERAYETDSQEKKIRLKKALKKTPFVLIENSIVENTNYRRPSEIYFCSDELRIYFFENNTKAFVSSEYSKNMVAILKELGVSDSIRISCMSKPNSIDDVALDYKSGYRRGLKGFDPDIKVDGLEYVLINISTEKSEIIWNKIAVKYSHCIKGKVLRSSRQDFSPNASTYKEEEMISNFGRLLIDTAWLPGSDRKMYRPSELTLDDFPESFVRDERLADQLGMKKNVVAKLAEEAGIPIDVLEFAKQNPEKVKQLMADKALKKPAFPERASSNTEHRRERLTEQLGDAPNKEYEQRDRSVRTTRGAVDPVLWLRNQYKNEAGQMICQVCKEEMPFRKRDGEHYFEAVEALSRDHFPMEHEAQFLALCPLCAAMYKEFVKQDEGAMVVLKNTLTNTDDFEVPLHLGELDTSIRFVETHYHDIKTILEEKE